MQCCFHTSIPSSSSSIVVKASPDTEHSSLRRGYYNTTFVGPFPGSSAGSAISANGAIIDFNFIVHTLRTWLNGVQLPPLDVTRPQADIKTMLVDGVNTVEVLVATTLGNAMRPVWFELKTSGTGTGSPGAGGVLPPVVGYGLIGEVTVVPYREEVLVV